MAVVREQGKIAVVASWIVRGDQTGMSRNRPRKKAEALRKFVTKQLD